MRLPDAFVQEMKSLPRVDAEDFFQSLDEPLPVSIRLNPHKPIPSGQLPAESDGRVLWNERGLYLKSRPSFTFEPLFHAGCYYVQEASSMFVACAVRHALKTMGKEQAPIRVLDLCAAPGGKSTAALDVLPEQALLVANELIRQRAYVLAENITKWGYPNGIVTQNEPKDFGAMGPCFDLLLTDVPCSGEGMFRKEPDALKDWSPENVRMCAERQRRIIQEAWPALMPGGCLIYSTCTYNTAENEENIQWMEKELNAEILEIPTDESWPVLPAQAGDMPVYRFMPHKSRGEGFFLALLRKSTDSGSFRSREKSARNEKAGKLKFDKEAFRRCFRCDWQDLLKHADLFSCVYCGAVCSAIPKEHEVFFQRLKKHLRILSAGISLGQFKGKDFLPDTALAHSILLDKSKLEICTVDKEQAITYLRHEAAVLPDTFAIGLLLVEYQNQALGWMKNIGPRANNLYPAEWRIRNEK